MEEPNSLEDDGQTLVDWLIGKVNHSNGLSHMALVNCDKGAAGTIYPLDSAEEPIAVARKVEEISPPTMATTTG